MSTVYVSNTAANGYGVGNDANNAGQMASKATPALTITGAITRATAGDTIIVNGGTYLEAVFVTISKLNLTFTADGAVTVQSGDSGARVFHVATGGSGVVFNPGFTLDGQGANTGLFTTQSNASVPLITIHGMVFKGATSTFLKTGEVGLFILDQNWSMIGCPTSSSQPIIQISPSATGVLAQQSVYQIGAGSMALGLSTATNTYAIRVISAGGPPTVTIDHVTITGSVPASKTLQGIMCDSTAALLTVTNCSVSFSSTADTATMIGINTAAAINPTLSGNTVSITTSGNASSLAGISHGATTDYRTQILQNTVTLTTTGTGATNTLNGIDLPNGAGATIDGNTVTLNLSAEATNANCVHGIVKNDVVIQRNILMILSALALNSGNGINLPNAAVVSGARVSIINNTVTVIPGGTAFQGGLAICIGDNGTPTTRNTFGSILVAGNAIDGGNHGILCGNVNGHTVIGNTTRNTKLALVDKNTNVGTSKPGLWKDNRCSLMVGTDSVLRCKGSQGNVYDGNWVYMDQTACVGIFIACNYDDVAVRPSSGCVYRNNKLVMLGGAIPHNPVAVDATSDCTFSANTYYCPDGFAFGQSGNYNGFVYQASSYPDLASWAAAHEANASAANPRIRTLVHR